MKLQYWLHSLNSVSQKPRTSVELFYGFHKTTSSSKYRFISRDACEVIYITCWTVRGCHIDKYAVWLFWHCWMRKFSWKSVFDCSKEFILCTVKFKQFLYMEASTLENETCVFDSGTLAFHRLFWRWTCRRVFAEAPASFHCEKQCCCCFFFLKEAC